MGLYRQAVKNVLAQLSYKQDFTVMKQVVKKPIPVKIPDSQKDKKSLYKTPIEFAPPRNNLVFDPSI